MTASRKILLPFLAALYCLSSYGMPVVTLDADTHQINLASKVEYYRDGSTRLGLNQVRQLPADVWQQTNGPELNFGFTQATYWFRVRLTNQGTRNRMMLLRGGYASFDHIEAFEVREGQVSISRSGAKVPPEERPFKHRYPLLPIELESDQSIDLYLKANNSGAFFLPLDLLDWQTFLFLDNEELIASGAYFGIWLIVIACNLLLYAILHHVSLLSFATFVFTLGLYQLSTYGLGSTFIAAMPSLHDHIIVFSVGFAIASLAWFADSLLELGKTNPIGRRFLQIIGGAAILLMTGYLFLPYSAIIPWLAGTAVANAVAVLVVGLRAAIKGNRLAMYATLAWSTPLLGTVLHALNRFSLIPSNVLTNQAQETGFVAMVLIMTVAIAAEMRRQSRQRGLMLLDLEQQASAREKEHLEKKVQERTRELESTLRELSDAHETLKELTTVDAVTGIKNRQYFDDIFEQEWRRAVREKYPISILLLDIDRFKNVNDTWGHLAGDECLREIASITGSFLKRPADILARYGGEEFVIVLPYVANENAEYLAEQIRSGIESSEISADGQIVKITISIGVCTVTPGEGDDARDLINAADMALYEAKSDGRNLVRNAGQLTVHRSRSAS